MPRFTDQVVFITGASSGIGAAVALEFAREGAKVALAARRIDRLEALRAEIEAIGSVALVLECDVTRRESIDRAVAQTVAELGGIDVVLANAGFGVSGSATRLETEDYRRQFDTNVFGVIDTVHATLPHLLERRGRLVIVSSVMGRVGLPASAPYCASKFAVLGFAESLYYDLADRGVSVTCINPGIVASEIRSVNNRGEFTGKPDPASKWLIMPVETAARKMVRAIYRKKPEYTFTGHGVFVVFVNRHFPRTARAIIRFFTKGRLAKVERLKRGGRE
ncbi:MAG: SDR family oxidoreductase [Candidatus Hydrogenedentes bacterium]|nr:SDR family oxidoreductase [Candidatus Hydrogenedentota bacterium]